MSDLISRQQAIDAFGGILIVNEEQVQRYIEGVNDKIKALPSIDAVPHEPTLYGYDLKFLAFIATVMEKENVTPEEALTIMKDAKRVAEMIYEEQAKNIRRAMEQYLKGEEDGLMNERKES